VLTRDGRLLFLTRCTRLFAYGALSVVLVFYLTSLGLTASQTGILLTLTLVGDTVVSSTSRREPTDREAAHADRRCLAHGGRRPGLRLHPQLRVLVVAGTLGVISPSGNEVGRFSRSSRPRCRTSSPVRPGDGIRLVHAGGSLRPPPVRSV